MSIKSTLPKLRVIAIDGPSAAGKSSVSQFVAKELGLNHINSGALYRYLAWKNASHLTLSELNNLWAENKLKIQFRPKFSLLWDGVDLSPQLQNHELSQKTSQLSQNPVVRDSVNAKLRELVQQSEAFCILEGRDIGSVVFPDAALKLFITASPEVRAHRRFEELKNSGKLNSLTMDDILKDVVARDQADATRTIAPLVCPADAITIDTGTMNFDAVSQYLIKLIRKSLDEKSTTT
jgi:cytidylate kinase